MHERESATENFKEAEIERATETVKECKEIEREPQIDLSIGCFFDRFLRVNERWNFL